MRLPQAEAGDVHPGRCELGLDLTRSFVVGDRWHDLEAGQQVGARGILVRTGYGRTEEAAPKAGVQPAVITRQRDRGRLLDPPR